jgi:hypothetical protein
LQVASDVFGVPVFTSARPDSAAFGTQVSVYVPSNVS